MSLEVRHEAAAKGISHPFVFIRHPTPNPSEDPEDDVHIADMYLIRMHKTHLFNCPCPCSVIHIVLAKVDRLHQVATANYIGTCDAFAANPTWNYLETQEDRKRVLVALQTMPHQIRPPKTALPPLFTLWNENYTYEKLLFRWKNDLVRIYPMYN